MVEKEREREKQWRWKKESEDMLTEIMLGSDALISRAPLENDLNHQDFHLTQWQGEACNTATFLLWTR